MLFTLDVNYDNTCVVNTLTTTADELVCTKSTSTRQLNNVLDFRMICGALTRGGAAAAAAAAEPAVKCENVKDFGRGVARQLCKARASDRRGLEPACQNRAAGHEASAAARRGSIA